MLASCEFSGQLIKVDVRGERILGTLTLRSGAAPQDVKLSPDGRVFYVADMAAGGVWRVDGERLRILGFVPTGFGAHGLYVSRDARLLYVTNRAAGSISILSFRTGRVMHTWHLPGGGSPDMGNVSADGKVLWLSGRWNADVYAISTRNGRLLARSARCSTCIRSPAAARAPSSASRAGRCRRAYHRAETRRGAGSRRRPDAEG